MLQRSSSLQWVSAAFASSYVAQACQNDDSPEEELRHLRFIPPSMFANGYYDIEVDASRRVAVLGVRQLKTLRSWSAQDIGQGHFTVCVHLDGWRNVRASGHHDFTLDSPRLAIYWQSRDVVKEACWRAGARETLVSLNFSPQLISGYVLQNAHRFPEELVQILQGDAPDFWWLDLPLPGELVDAARPLLQELENSPLRSLYYQAKYSELIALTLLKLQSVRDGASVSARLSARSRRIVEKVREELAEMASSPRPASGPRTISDIARRNGISTTGLCVAFKAAYQVTILEYMHEMRMSRAKQLLLNSDLDVKEIAWQAGYSYTSNFALAFKAHFGLTPRQCRLGG